METQGKRILIVDDHSLTRDMVRHILKGVGFPDIVSADNAHLAFELLREQRFDAIICDWNMPSCTGLELLKRVRADKRFAAIPFLMLTAEAYRENVQEAISAGVTDYVSKPFTAGVLVEKLEAMLRSCGATPPSA